MPIQLENSEQTLDTQKLAEKLFLNGGMPSAPLISSIDESAGRIIGYVKGVVWSAAALLAGAGLFIGLTRDAGPGNLITYISAAFMLLSLLRAYQNIRKPGRLSDAFMERSLLASALVKFAPKAASKAKSEFA